MGEQGGVEGWRVGGGGGEGGVRRWTRLGVDELGELLLGHDAVGVLVVLVKVRVRQRRRVRVDLRREDFVRVGRGRAAAHHPGHLLPAAWRAGVGKSVERVSLAADLGGG